MRYQPKKLRTEKGCCKVEKIRLGIVGCGKMMKNHVDGVQLLDNVEVTAFADVVLENAQALAQDFKNAYVTTDYTSMVDHVDAVLVALPHDLHYECGMFFARCKKHVLMEKPLCNTEAECIRLIETCEEEGVVLMCAYPVRHWPGIVRLKEMIDSGEYGKVMQMSVWTEQLTKYESETNWGATGRLGGGQFFSHGCHYIDLLLWFLGNPVKGSHFGTKVGVPWLLEEGTSAATLLFENGAIGYHGATWGARGTRLGWDCQVMTEKGLLDYDRHKGIIKLYNQSTEHSFGAAESQDYQIVWKQEDDDVLSKQTQYEIKHFTECILTGKRPVTDGRTALKSLQVIWKMYDAEKHNTLADLTDIKVQ